MKLRPGLQSLVSKCLIRGGGSDGAEFVRVRWNLARSGLQADDRYFAVGVLSMALPKAALRVLDPTFLTGLFANACRNLRLFCSGSRI
eukprot:scaffold1280_cov246-Pinguiococcus_pyrenoidosus.AAC.26